MKDYSEFTNVGMAIKTDHEANIKLAVALEKLIPFAEACNLWVNGTTFSLTLKQVIGGIQRMDDRKIWGVKKITFDCIGIVRERINEAWYTNEPHAYGVAKEIARAYNKAWNDPIVQFEMAEYTPEELKVFPPQLT